MAGLGSANLRLVDTPGKSYAEPEPSESIDLVLDGDVDVQALSITVDGDLITIEDMNALKPGSNKSTDFNANLADEIDNGILGSIGQDLLEAIEQDEQSRMEWMDARATGIDMLGIKIEPPTTSSAESGAPVEGMSRVRHPGLLEAVIRFQSNARSELLPTDGPVKIRIDDPNVSIEDNPRADDLQQAMNIYLTVTDTDYYEDTDRLLFRLGLWGSEFKKVYHHPLKRRPVAESVEAENLIVSNTAKGLDNAARVTHRIPDMRKSTMKRMMLAGAYRDIELPSPSAVSSDTAVEQRQEGANVVIKKTQREQDNTYEVYECYTELDIPGYEHEENGKPTGLPLPYKVSIEKHTQTVLEIRRNWREGDDTYAAKRVFVHYIMVPGLGFYGLGFLHIMGQITQAITAAWREFIDAGMFANFPGFLVAKAGTRQQTNTFRIPPGGGHAVETNGASIRDAVMPLPYKEPGPAFIAFIQHVEEVAARLAGTAEIQVGEGRQDAPVGTTIALIEQAMKPLIAIHKRLYAAQARELQLLRDLFTENPEALFRNIRGLRHNWDRAEILKALNDYDLTPQADPNTASHMQRLMKAVALKQLQQQSPDLYDAKAVDTLVLRMTNVAKPEEVFAQNPQPAPDPKLIEAEAKKAVADATVAEKQANVQLKGIETQLAQAKGQTDLQIAGLKAQSEQAKLGVAGAKLQVEQQRIGLEPMKLQLDAKKHQDEMALAAADLAGKHALQAEAQQNEDDRERVAMALGQADVERDVALAEHKELNENKRTAVKEETAKEIADANNKTSIEIARIAAKAAKARSNAQTTNRKK